MTVRSSSIMSEPGWHDVRGVIESAYSDRDIALTANPDSPEWATAPRITIHHDYLNRPIPGPPTEVRSRWTGDHLHLLYICPYAELNLKPDPVLAEETPRLWNWDVAEAFIGSELEPVTRYREFQLSPRGEWLDLDIDRTNPEPQTDWSSGFTVKSHIDTNAKIWYGEMRIPFAAIESRPAREGGSLRVGLYRIAGVNPRTYYAWQPTGTTTFHLPEAFGTLRLR